MTNSSPDTSSTSELSYISEGEEDVTIQAGLGKLTMEREMESGVTRERESSVELLVEYGVAY